MKKIITTVLILLISIFTIAQEAQDSLQQEPLEQKAVQEAKEKFPEASVFNFDFSQSLGRSFSSELEGLDLSDGEIAHQKNYLLSANIPLYKNCGWELSTSLSYQLNQYKFQNIENRSSFATPPLIFEQNGTLDFHYFSAELNATYFTYLFNKIPIISSASILSDASDTRLGRIKGSIGFTLLVKGTERTLIGIGVVGYIDASSQIPALPVFLFKHKFKNPKWELIVLLPRKVFLRKSIGEHGRLSLGGTFGSSILFVDSNDQLLGNFFEYNQLESKAGLLYEHRFNEFLIVRLQAGMHNVFNSILLEKGDSANNYIYENSQDAAVYFKVGFSVDPFAKNKD